MQPPQTTSNIGYQQPAQIHSQNLDQFPATSESHGNSNKQQIEELYPTQQLGDYDFGSTQQKGKEKAKKTNKNRWSSEEDLCVVSGVLNCGGDILIGTDQKKAKL